MAPNGAALMRTGWVTWVDPAGGDLEGRVAHVEHLGADTIIYLECNSAGLIVVREPAEREMGLPGPEHELALVLQDRRFNRDNQLVFKRMMMDDMNGVLGDRVLVRKHHRDPDIAAEGRWQRWTALSRRRPGIVLAIGLLMLAALAAPALRHRLILSFEAETEGVRPDEIVARVLEAARRG